MFGRRKIQYKTNQELRAMVRAGVVTSQALDAAVEATAPGVTTVELDRTFRDVLDRNGATSNFLGYYGFPATICASPNDVVVHGIPNDRPLEDGDIVSIDGGAIVDGWHGDSARTVLVGETSRQDAELSEMTRAAMWRGIAAAATAQRVGEIGAAIESFVRKEAGGTYGIVEEYVGHGIGTEMHMAPDVPNYRTRDSGPRIKPGMALAIEPMLVTGSTQTEVLDDDWTVKTVDGSHASQWEHSVAFHRDGIWVLTAEDGGANELAALGVTVAPIPD